MKPDPGPSKQVTVLLADWSKGERPTREALILLVYNELRQLAAPCLRRERSDHILPATVLVHEAYLRLVEQDSVNWQDWLRFLWRRSGSWWTAHAAMPPKSAVAEFRESGLPKPLPCHSQPAELRALYENRTRLAVVDPQQGRTVELRVFPATNRALAGQGLLVLGHFFRQELERDESGEA